MTRTVPPSVQAILEEVASRNHITAADILGRSRLRSIAWPRQEAFALIRAGVNINGQPASYPLIGQWLGFDHATVIHGVRQHAERVASAATAAVRLETLDRRLSWSNENPRAPITTQRAVA